LMTFTTDSKTNVTADSKTNVTAKADEVKAIIKTKNEIIRLGKRLDQMTEPDLQVSFHPPCATAFTTSIVIFIYSRFTISILIFNYLLLDHLDHHSQTFTFGNFRVCEKHCDSRKTASLWAKTEVTQLGTPDSTKPLGDPEPRPNILTRNLYRNTLVPISLQSIGRHRNSEKYTQTDSFIFTYLDLSR
jgi:hypothetical protein